MRLSKALSALVVEDDPASAKLLTVLLRDVGFTVQSVPSAEEALEVAAWLAPELVVVDLVLPLMSGFLLTQQLVKRRPAPVVIAVSVFNGAKLERDAREAGCAAFVRKPIDPISFLQLALTLLGVTP